MCLLTLIAPPADAAISPLSPDLQSALDGIRPDPRPKEIIKGTHYVTSNEPKQHLFHKAFKGSGGLYVGVGAEQNYLFMTWSRPEVAVLMDFDDVIPRLHHVYASIFRRMETPEAFLGCWTSDKTDTTAPCSYEKVRGRRREAGGAD